MRSLLFLILLITGCPKADKGNMKIATTDNRAYEKKECLNPKSPSSTVYSTNKESVSLKNVSTAKATQPKKQYSNVTLIRRSCALISFRKR
ncbi:MAG: hypothetical protein Q8928_10585 [Bacteroidota bacterium]|nr:hypothetical protein [Bacteroidota bacterium]